MLLTRGYLVPCRERTYLDRRRVFSGEPSHSLPQLADVVVPPGPQRAVGLYRGGVVPSRCHLSPRGKCAHLYRHGAICHTAVAKAAFVIETPPPQRAVNAQGECMVHAGNALPCAQSAHLHWRGAADCIRKPKLTIVIFSP